MKRSLWILAIMSVGLVIALCLILRAVHAPIEPVLDEREPSTSSVTATLITVAHIEARQHVVTGPSLKPADLPPSGLPDWVPGVLGHASRKLP